MSPPKYETLHAHGEKAFDDKVNSALSRGALLYGPPQILNNRYGDVVFYQTVVIPSEEREARETEYRFMASEGGSA